MSAPTRIGIINTISTLIYTEVRRGIKPSMNALSTIMFLSAIVLLVLTNIDFDKKKSGRKVS